MIHDNPRAWCYVNVIENLVEQGVECAILGYTEIGLLIAQKHIQTPVIAKIVTKNNIIF